MSDTLSDYFNLPANADTSKIEVYTSAASYNNGTLTWGDETPYSATVTISTNKKTITVTGFDYSANCVTKKAKDAAGTDFGKKLVIYIPIEKDATKAQFGGYLPTNDDATLNDPKGDKEGYKADGAHKDCTVVAPTLKGINKQIDAGSSYSTTDLFTGSQWPDGSNNAGVDMVYTIEDSTGATVATKTVPAGKNSAEVDWVFATGKQNNNTYPTPGTYTFKLGCTVSCTNPEETTKHTAASTTVTGTITVKRTTATVTLTKTITGLSAEDAATVRNNLKIYAKDSSDAQHELTKNTTTGIYSAELAAGTYTIVETGKDVTGYDCATSGDTTFTVVADTDKSLALTNAYTAKKYSITYEYTGTVPDGAAAQLPPPVSDVAYKSEQTVDNVPTLPGYSFVGWTSEQVTPDASGKFTMPNKDVVFKGSWTEKDKVTIKYVAKEGGTVTLANETLNPDTGTAAGSTATARTGYRFVGWYDNSECTGTALSTEAEYIPTKPEAGWAEKTYYAKFESLTYTITFTTEAGGTLTGKTEYTDLAYNAVFPTEPEKVANTGYYFDGWYKDNTKVTSFPEKVTENATYTAKWLSYNSINLDLTGKIQKTLNSDVELNNQSFTINVKQTVAEAASATATATATATVSATTDSGTGYTGSAPFQKDDFKLTFTAPGIYNYSIVEAEDGQLAGMTYDVGFANGHTMIVNVDENTTTNELYVKSVTIDDRTVYAHGENEATPTWLTITNNYVEPKNAQVTKKEVVVTQPTDALKTAVDAFAYNNGLTVLYPTGDGVANNTLEVPYGTTAATLLYKITVYAGTKTYYEFDDVGAELVYAEHANVVQENNTFKVTFEDGAEYAYVYVAVTHGLNFDNDDNRCTVDNTVLGQKAETTVKEKDPNSVDVDFSRYVYKKLTVTGDKAFTGATFEATLDGTYYPPTIINSLEDESAIATYAHAVPGAAQLHKTLTVSFDANDDLTQPKPFLGTINFNAEGAYEYTLKEVIPEGATGYDTSEFRIRVVVMADNNAQMQATVEIWYNNQWEPIEGRIQFENTIDTGKDDYYPIIIPTIINKDTGMLNKTDHFAYVIGYPDGTVHPNGQITRAEVATIFFRLLRDEVRDGAFTTSNTYSDVAYGKWYNNPISTMSALGIITGYPDGTFKPNKPITRAEFAAIAARFDETQSGKSATFSDVIGHWAAKEIGIAYYNDWIKGYPDGTFKPDQNITRAEAMTLINRVLERKPESPADLLTNMNKWTDNMDTSKWYYLDVQEATNSHGYTRKTFNYELWRQMLPDPDWSRYER